MNVGFVSLGCSKNLLDTEMTIGLFKNNKFNIVNDPSDADVIVINTCGFIESAKEEAINTILEMAEYKQGRCKYLIAMGCLVERYKDELEKALPEVDLFIKYSEYNNIWGQIESVIGKVGEDEEDEKLDFMDRVVSTGENFAYLRIAYFARRRGILWIKSLIFRNYRQSWQHFAERMAAHGISHRHTNRLNYIR